MVSSIMQLACEKIIGQSTSICTLEICEEKLYRLLKESVETGLNLSDLVPMSAKVNSNELEILYGKDFHSMRYIIQSGFNLKSVS